MNYPQLQPGDVFLFDGGKPDPLVPRAISRFQARIFADESSAVRWRHVGILDRNLQVWDAMPSLNVRARPLREVLVGVGRLCVVRPKKPVDPDRLSEGLLEFSRGQYKIFASDTGGELAKRLLDRLPKKGKKRAKARRQVPNPNFVICSTFVTYVLRYTTGYNFLKHCAVQVPGDFAVDKDFAFLELEWCRLDFQPAVQPSTVPPPPLNEVGGSPS